MDRAAHDRVDRRIESEDRVKQRFQLVGIEVGKVGVKLQDRAADVAELMRAGVARFLRRRFRAVGSAHGTMKIRFLRRVLPQAFQDFLHLRVRHVNVAVPLQRRAQVFGGKMGFDKITPFAFDF